jgi:catechol 2,3-dioxygenase-like lactoylglutathione lyase family enzyme
MSLGRSFGAPPGPAAGADRRGRATFSVVIAAYDAAGSIGEAVESALAQTEPPLEVIVYDDGSTDATLSALEPYRDRIVYVAGPHAGVAAARNAALKRATGEFVAVLDADDAYLPERLEALADLAAARPDLEILCTDVLFEVEGRVVGRFGESTPFEVVNQRAAILERCFCVAPAFLRSKVVGVGGYDVSMRTGEDWDLVARLLFAGAVAGVVDEPLYRYRIRRGSLTADRVAALRERVHFLERVRGTYELDGEERAALSRSLARQHAALALTEVEAALRARSDDARGRALAAALVAGVGLRTRAAALAAAVAPRAAARVLERRALRGKSRLERVV